MSSGPGPVRELSQMLARMEPQRRSGTNLVAAAHHDHLFVAAADADPALAVLQRLSRLGRAG